MLNLTFGSDPEVFVRDTASKELICPYGIVKGTKRKPTPLPLNSGFVQVDGMALEFNSHPVPLQHFAKSVRDAKENLEILVKEKNNKFSLEIKPSAIFTEEVFRKAPDECKELGCDPDYNAYTMEPNPRPDPAKATGSEFFRTCGGHIHIGWGENFNIKDQNHLNDCQAIVKMCDIVLSKFSNEYDKDTKRRSLYGGLGTFRPKPYGVEYRALSNFWLKSDDLLETLVVKLTNLNRLASYYNVYREYTLHQIKREAGWY